MHHDRNPHSLARWTIATSLLCCAASSWAQTSQAAPLLGQTFVQLTGRDSQVSLLNINNGFGTAQAVINAGSLSSNSLTPETLELVNTEGATATTIDGIFYADITATWNLTQTYQSQQIASGVQLLASSSFQMQSSGVAGFLNVGNNGCSPCSSSTNHGYTSHNFLALNFTVSGDTPFDASGLSSKGQLTRLQFSTDDGASWASYAGWNEGLTNGGTPLIGPQETRAWSQSGLLVPGLYRLASTADTYGSPTYPTYEWSVDMRLNGAQLLAPIPEPGAGLLAAVGLAMCLGAPGIRQRLRRRQF